MNYTLTQHIKDWSGCTKCTIGERAYQKCFYRGTIPCEVLFIGEAPGKTEDAMGIPFVGRAGKLLDQWIEDARAFRYKSLTPRASIDELFKKEVRPKIAITNLVLCRPCDRLGGPNRAPTQPEQSRCFDRLMEFVRMAKPKCYVFLGKNAEAAIPHIEDDLEQNLKLLKLRHPAYVLRQGGAGCPEDREQRRLLSEFIRRSLP